jgi:hypothetical protein
MAKRVEEIDMSETKLQNLIDPQNRATLTEMDFKMAMSSAKGQVPQFVFTDDEVK